MLCLDGTFSSTRRWLPLGPQPRHRPGTHPRKAPGGGGVRCPCKPLGLPWAPSRGSTTSRTSYLRPRRPPCCGPGPPSARVHGNHRKLQKAGRKHRREVGGREGGGEDYPGHSHTIRRCLHNHFTGSIGWIHWMSPPVCFIGVRCHIFTFFFFIIIISSWLQPSTYHNNCLLLFCSRFSHPLMSLVPMFQCPRFKPKAPCRT